MTVLKYQKLSKYNLQTGENNIYDETADVGQRVISMRWVITQKLKNNKMIYKARLVANRFEENLNNICKDSPTSYKNNFRLVLSLVSNSWTIHSFDIKSAFLQGKKLIVMFT